jgi:hypothetical protein
MAVLSLAEGLPEEIKRVSELRDEYLKLPGNVGLIVSALMKASIDNAIRVQASGDVIGMMRVYEDLKGFTE